MTEAAERARLNWLRLRALMVAVPLALIGGAAGSALVDPALERAVEDGGADIVGAKVDVDGVDFQLGASRIVMGRMQVGHPEQAFVNLMEAREIVVDLQMGPLLEKKVVADSFVVRGIQFGTPRETSGILENPSPESGRLWREVNAWADNLNLPEFSLEGLQGLVDTGAIDDDSLATVNLGRSLAADADSLSQFWRSEVDRIDPRPLLDSARVLSAQLANARESRPNLIEVTRLVRSARAMSTRLVQLQADVRTADSTARADLTTMRMEVGSLGASVEADMAYGRRLLNLPSLEAPNFSPILFRETALSWLKPVLYWVHTAERYIPPGLDPRRRPGPLRRRAPGTTVAFPGRARYPEFLLRRGALDLEIGGEQIQAGTYDGSVEGLSSAPALTAEPLRIELNRTQAPRGPDRVSVRASLDHTTLPLTDTVNVGVGGVDLPSVEVPELGTQLVLGEGDADLRFVRRGERVDAVMRWSSDQIRWEGTPAIVGDTTAIGSSAWTRAFLWRSLRGVSQLEVEVALEGALDNPSLHIESNLGAVLAESLRAEVGEEVQRAEARLRSEVDARIQPAISEAQQSADAFEVFVAEQVAPLTNEVADLRARIESAIASLVPGPL